MSPTTNQESKNQTLVPTNPDPLEGAGIQKPPPMGYEEWYLLKETEKKYKEKLINNVKDEIQRNMITRKIKFFEEYEERRERMAKWEKDKDRQLKQARRELREKRLLEKELKLRKQEFGEKAFKDWLRRSIEDL